jgi:hypothetical protein
MQQQQQQQPTFFPVVDMCDVKSVEKEQKEIADAKADPYEHAWIDYEDHRLLTPNTGYVRWTDDATFRATLKYIQEVMPLNVRTYKSADPAKRLGQFTRCEELQLTGDFITVDRISTWNGTEWEPAFVHVFTHGWNKNRSGAGYEAHGDECWQTVCLFSDGDFDEDAMEEDGKVPDWRSMPAVASQMMHNSTTAVLFTDVIAAAMRKHRERAREQVLAMIMAEKRPLTTKMGAALRASQLYERRVFNLVGAFLL